MSPSMSATVIRYTKVDSNDLSPMTSIEEVKAQQIINANTLAVSTSRSNSS